MNGIKLQIKELIIDALQLEDIKLDDIVDSDPLFGEGCIIYRKCSKNKTTATK